MRFNPEKVWANVRKAEIGDLLDRVTVFREGMEPAAIEIIEAELARRGIGPEEIEQHHRTLRHRIVRREDGLPARCSFCPRAAIESRLDWHRVWGWVPIFRRTFYFCDMHWEAQRYH